MALPPPDPAALSETERVSPVETTEFRLRARLVGATLLENGEIHLIAADPDDPSITMIVAFPDIAACAPATPIRYRTLVQRGRDTFIAFFGMPPKGGFLPLEGLIDLYGMGFFDRSSGERGAAPNGIQISPTVILSLVGRGFTWPLVLFETSGVGNGTSESFEVSGPTIFCAQSTLASPDPDLVPLAVHIIRRPDERPVSFGVISGGIPRPEGCDFLPMEPGTYHVTTLAPSSTAWHVAIFAAP